MVGRGALGAPWRLAEIAAALHGTPAPQIPTGAALADLVTDHYDQILGFYGTDLGVKAVSYTHLDVYKRQSEH